jgi:hypothetical protein
MMENKAMSPAEVVKLHHMSEAQYDSQRVRLLELYGDSGKEAAAKRDQAFAVLFYKSGWTQEKLAKKEKKSEGWVNQRLRLGRFLNFLTTVRNPENPPVGLTERRFRDIWAETDKAESNERIRFQQVLDILNSKTEISRPKRSHIGDEILKAAADGKWHSLQEIAQKIGKDEGHVAATLAGMKNNGTYNVTAEQRTTRQHGVQYRIFPKNIAISLNELMEKLAPIVKDLEIEGRKSVVAIAPAQVMYLTGKIRKLLEEWSERSARRSGQSD